MTVMLTGTSPNAELYSRALSNAYRWYYRLIDPDWSIEQAPEIWIKKAWRDPVLAQAMQTRMHMVAGREWQIQPGRKNPSPDDTRAADVVADAFARIAKFSEARALLATSVLRGSAYAFTEGTRETVTLAGLRGNWWTPRKLRNISKQRFIYTPETITHEDGRRSIEVQTRFYPLMDPWPVVIPQEFAERLIKVIYLDEEDRLTGIGGRPLLESVYFMFWCKAEVMKSGLQTLEKWAGGMLIGKTDLNAQPGEMGRDSDSVRDKMLTTLESMRGRHVGVVDKEDEIEHIDGGASNSVFLEFLQYMDDKIVGLILGSVLPFGQGGDGSGSYARAVEERAVSDLILDFDKQNISEAITDTVIRLFWKNNRPQLAAAGLADAAMPQFAILPERRDDFAANAQILSQAINSGMPIKASEAYEKLGLTQPTQEEIDAGEVIEKEEPAGGGFPFRESPGAKFGDDPLDGVTVNGYNSPRLDDTTTTEGRTEMEKFAASKKKKSDIDRLIPDSLDEDERQKVRDTMQGMIDSGHLTIDLPGAAPEQDDAEEGDEIDSGDALARLDAGAEAADDAYSAYTEGRTIGDFDGSAESFARGVAIYDEAVKEAANDPGISKGLLQDHQASMDGYAPQVEIVKAGGYLKAETYPDGRLYTPEMHELQMGIRDADDAAWRAERDGDKEGAEKAQATLDSLSAAASEMADKMHKDEAGGKKKAASKDKPGGKRKRCPKGQHKNKKSGACEPKK